ncbi:hypothetical protein HAX54_019192, partial [Datura stramonium]|nr:hypothetical protein [Datura stramonium]
RHSMNRRWVAGCVQCTEGFKDSRRTIRRSTASKREPSELKKVMLVVVTSMNRQSPLAIAGALESATGGPLVVFRELPVASQIDLPTIPCHYFTSATHRRFENLHRRFVEDSPMSLEG